MKKLVMLWAPLSLIVGIGMAIAMAVSRYFWGLSDAGALVFMSTAGILGATTMVLLFLWWITGGRANRTAWQIEFPPADAPKWYRRMFAVLFRAVTFAWITPALVFFLKLKA